MKSSIINFKKIANLLVCVFINCLFSGVVLSLLYDYKSTFVSVNLQPTFLFLLFKKIHKLSINIIFALIYTHLLQSIYTARFIANRKKWISGVTILSITLAAAIFGEILPKTQKSFWLLKIIGNILEQSLNFRCKQIDSTLDSNAGTNIFFLMHIFLSLFLASIFFAIHVKKKLFKITKHQISIVLIILIAGSIIMTKSKSEPFDEFYTSKISVSWYLFPLFNFLYSISNPKLASFLSITYLIALALSPFIIKKFEIRKKQYSRLRSIIILLLQLISIAFQKYGIKNHMALLMFANYAILLTPFCFKKLKK